MMTFDAVLISIAGLDRAEVERWIAQDLLRPATQEGHWLFRDIDVARLQLIQELRHSLRLDEDALPTVLHLMDQLYDARRRLRRLRDAVEREATPAVREAMLAALLDR